MSELPISQVAEINPRSYPPNGLKLSDPVSFIPMADVSESGAWTGDKRGPLIAAAGGYTNFQEGDVLLAKITPCLENGKGAHAVGLCNGYGYGSTEFHVLRAKGSISARYLFHITQHEEFRLKAEMQMTGTAGQRRVPTDFFDRYRAYVPSKADQTKIAEILDTLDAAIRGTEGVVAKLKAMKQGLLHDLLTRGIGANGDLRPPQPEAPHLYKQTPLGWLPKEWDAEPLSKLIKFCYRYPSYYGIDYVDDGIPEVRGELIEKDGSLTPLGPNYRYISETTARRFPRVRVQKDDIVMSVRGTIGKFGRVTEPLVGAVITANLLRLQPDPNEVSPEWLMFYLMEHDFQNRLDAACSATTIKTIQVPELLSLLIARPTAKEQDVIRLRIVEYLKKQFVEEQLLDKLRLQKSGLMDDLLTGRTPVTALL